MRVHKPARRIRKLNSLFQAEGGIRLYVLRRLDKEGDPIEDVAETLTTRAGERIPVHTLYQWARAWRLELALADGKEEAIATHEVECGGRAGDARVSAG